MKGLAKVYLHCLQLEWHPLQGYFQVSLKERKESTKN